MKLAHTSTAILASVALISVAHAQSLEDHHEHHSADQGTAQGQPAPAPDYPGQDSGSGMMLQGGMPMMGGQGGMMSMDQMRSMMRHMMPGMMGQSGSMGAMDGPGGTMPFEHLEGRLAFLRTELEITNAQAATWDAFAEAARSAAGTVRGQHDQMMQSGQPSTWPDRLKRQAELLAARLEALETIRATAQPLYAALSEEQKRLADELMAGPMGMM